MDTELMHGLLEKFDETWSTSYDILAADPALTLDDAYDLQFSYKKRQASRGQPIAGYQASFTSRAVRQSIPDMPVPWVGTLLQRNFAVPDDGFPVGDEGAKVEAEVGMVLKRDLVGPGVTPAQAAAAVDGIFPAIEFVPNTFRGGVDRWSKQMLIAIHNMGISRVVTGTQMTLPTIDLALEGVTVSTDGRLQASATAAEVMGGPMIVLAAMANRLARHHEYFRAGTTVITGSCVPQVWVTAADSHVLVEFTRLGRVEVRLQAAEPSEDASESG